MKISGLALTCILAFVFFVGAIAGVLGTYGVEWKALADIRAETLSHRTENENLVATRAKLVGDIQAAQANSQKQREKLYAADPKVDAWRKSVVPGVMSKRVRDAAKRANAESARSNRKEHKG